MKNKKGFTLIELLAVIVILAVIMVIAVPKILDIITKSRESAAESSIKLVKDAIKTQVSTGQMSGVSFEKEGECYLFDFENNNNNALNLSLKNKEKIGGSIKYCNGKFEDDTLTFDGTSISDVEVSKVCKRASTLHTETCTQTDTTYYCSGAGYANGDTIAYGSLGTKGSLTSGDAFDCDVNGDGIYDPEKERFYYVSDYYNTTIKSFNSNVAVLIYYNNFVNGEANNTSASLIAYDSSNENWHGPVTAITNLPTNSQWRNVSLTNSVRAILTETGTNSTIGGTLPSNFNYSGYAARFLTIQEVKVACGDSDIKNSGYFNTCNYLLENTKYSSDSMGTYGYWLENSNSQESVCGWNIDGPENRCFYPVVSFSANYGVRPSIEVLKSNIEY